MERISKKLTNWLISNKVITTEEKEVYEYGIFQMIVNMLDTLSILSLSILFNELTATCCYIVCFCMLRKYAGGYHAQSLIGCYGMTIGSTLLMLITIKVFKVPLIVLLSLWLVSLIIIFLFAPVQNRNKILDELERTVYRRLVFLIVILESIFMWVLYGFNFIKEVQGILFSNVLIVISMLIELIGMTKNGRESNLLYNRKKGIKINWIQRGN